MEGENAIIYVVSTSDAENDELFYSSSVSNSFVPLAINGGKYHDCLCDLFYVWLVIRVNLNP